MPENIIRIQSIPYTYVYSGNIPGRIKHVLVRSVQHNQSFLVRRDPDFVHYCYQFLRSGILQANGINHKNSVVLKFVRQRAFDGQTSHFPGHLVSKIPGLRAKSNPAASPDRRTSASCACHSCSFLSEEFPPAPAHVRSAFGGSCPGSSIRKLHDHHLVEHISINGGFENIRGKLELSHAFAALVVNIHR